MSSTSKLALFSLLILLRGRVITGPRDLLRALSRVGLNKDLSPSELSQALEQLYVEEPDGTRQLLVPFRDSISKVCLIRLLTFAIHYTLRPRQVPIRPTPDFLFSSHRPHFPLLSPSAQSKPNVDRSFLRQLLAILRITFPSYRSPEVGIVLIHSTFLVLRTVLSIGIAKLDGKIVKALVRNYSLTSTCKCANVRI
jgi:ATP-binding cassette subfamily D (ALD) long-chain fatty acid import protein